MSKTNDGKTAYFLVRDERLPEVYGKGDGFVEWLLSEGFSVHERFGGSWLYVTALYINLNTKTLACGMPGIKLFEPVGGHAVTIEEFKTIYAIFKKYDGKAPFEF